MSDRFYTRVRYRDGFGYWPSLKNPKTFNEKIQWLKFHDHNPLREIVADKIDCRDYWATKADPTILPKLYATGDKAEDIPFDDLPDQYVIKAAHSCNMTRIVTDGKPDRESIRHEVSTWLNHDFYKIGRERCYKNLPHRWIVEEFLSEADRRVPADYKLIMFNGELVLITVDFDRFGDHRRSLFTPGWKKLDAAWHYPKAEHQTPRPRTLDQMIEIARRIGEDFNMIRVDFYEVNGQLRAGEITNWPCNGFARIDPVELDRRLGDQLDLSPVDSQKPASKEAANVRPGLHRADLQDSERDSDPVPNSRLSIGPRASAGPVGSSPSTAHATKGPGDDLAFGIGSGLPEAQARATG